MDGGKERLKKSGEGYEIKYGMRQNTLQYKHQQMSGVEKATILTSPPVGKGAIPQHFLISQFAPHYEEAVCWLFQTIQNHMLSQQLDNTRHYLYYAKFILDFYIAEQDEISPSELITVHEVVTQVLHIFIQNLQDKGFKNVGLAAGDLCCLARALGEYPCFQSIQNPYKIIESLNHGLEPSKIELMEELITLALTLEECRNVQAEPLALGCLKSVSAYKSWDVELSTPMEVSGPQINFCESLFTNLLVAIKEL